MTSCSGRARDGGDASRVPHRYVIVPTTSTDFVTLGLAIFLGGLAGVLISFPIGEHDISLSSSVGTLLAGLAVGHLRTRYPLVGRSPRVRST